MHTENATTYAAHVEAYRSGVALRMRPDLGLIQATGDDAEGLLHRIVSNEIRDLPPGAGALAFLLTSRGKFIADLRMMRTEAGFLIEVERNLVEATMEGIDRYHFAEDFEMADISEDTSFVGLYGPKAQQLFGKLDAAVTAEISEYHWRGIPFEERHLIARATRVTGTLGFEIAVPKPVAEAFLAHLQEMGKEFGLVETGEDAWHCARIEAGVPVSGHDLDENVVPLEARLYRGINFEKGCYVGQETIAMMDTRGKAPRLLMQLKVEGGPDLRKGVELYHPDWPRVAGTITSAVTTPEGHQLALAYVKNKYAVPGEHLFIGAPDASAKAELRDVPWKDQVSPG